jgi:rRNA maturation RNase YbeY
MIRFQTLDVMMPHFDADRVRSWIVGVVEGQGFRVGELYYIFCDDETLLRINQERLGHDFYTDIVTFPLTSCDEVVSSEFYISLDRVAENALVLGRDFNQEFYRVIIHGVLHLIGFDDLDEASRTLMRSMEDRCLEILNN